MYLKMGFSSELKFELEPDTGLMWHTFQLKLGILIFFDYKTRRLSPPPNTLIWRDSDKEPFMYSFLMKLIWMLNIES